jgi:hypothetical protein
MAAKLEPELARWIASCLAMGVPASTLAAELVTERHLPAARARRAVARVAAQPATEVAIELHERIRRLTWQAKVRRTLLGLGRGSRTVPRVRTPSRPRFLERYYSQHRPVVLTDLVTKWPAFRKWTPQYFKRRFGAVKVKVTVDRDQGAVYESNSGSRSRVVRFCDYVDWVESAGATNDRYLVANNDPLKPGRLKALLDDVTLDRRLLDPARTRGLAYLWYGPKGTVTSLHHDTTNILFCQVRGKKRVRLISPLYAELLEQAIGYYSLWDPEAPDGEAYPELDEVQQLCVDLRAGEALLIPAGWWHHVRALTVSISVSLTNFVFPNDFEADNPYA